MIGPALASRPAARSPASASAVVAIHRVFQHDREVRIAPSTQARSAVVKRGRFWFKLPAMRTAALFALACSLPLAACDDPPKPAAASASAATTAAPPPAPAQTP